MSDEEIMKEIIDEEKKDNDLKDLRTLFEEVPITERFTKPIIEKPIVSIAHISDEEPEKHHWSDVWGGIIWTIVTIIAVVILIFWTISRLI